MASSENNSDEGGTLLKKKKIKVKYKLFFFIGTAADYEHMIQFEYLKEKYREVLSKLKSVSNDKERYICNVTSYHSFIISTICIT